MYEHQLGEEEKTTRERSARYICIYMPVCLCLLCSVGNMSSLLSYALHSPLSLSLSRMLFALISSLLLSYSLAIYIFVCSLSLSLFSLYISLSISLPQSELRQGSKENSPYRRVGSDTHHDQDNGHPGAITLIVSSLLFSSNLFSYSHL